MAFGRDVYLDRQPWDQALARYQEALAGHGAMGPGPAAEVPVTQALGRVTAAPIYAAISSPHYPAAAMDGFAVRAGDTFGAAETSPRRLAVGREAMPVDTGDPLPPGYDAVIMIEDIHWAAEDTVEIIAPATPWQHVRPIGEDLVATEMILPAGVKLAPEHLAAVLAGGVTRVQVYRPMRVAIIPTGDELVSPGPDLPPGAIPEFNGAMLAGMVQTWGGEPELFGPVPDQWEELRAALARALPESDMVLVNAGSSAGRDDYTVRLVRELGEVYTHGVATRPGKPVILGRVGDKPVIGIPGYPVSAALAMELFVRPLLYRWQGLLPPEPEVVTARLARKLYSSLGAEEFVRVRLGRVGETLVANPLPRGAGVITSLVRADGWLVVPRLAEGVAAGEMVRVILRRPRAQIEGQILCVGSHDVALDLLDNYLRRLYPGESLASAHVGSIGGLMALRAGEAVCAGLHLLDPETGTYNETYVKRYLDRPCVLVNLVYRQQGLMVQPGNPKNITGIKDLARPEVEIVNRQPGAGTRVFLDYLLAREGIDPSQVKGYRREQFSHLAVAASVAGGTADAGLGILAAAKALGLEFIPLGQERYDLLFPRKFMAEARVQHLLTAIRDPGFQAEVAGMGGYDLSDCGRVMWEG
ncbi:MAG: molybdopterin biosynthesis protein [Clostridia bacterium]|nr:MAG: molybdopterin biosynthesis protein [Clostridia bacterium]